jgi:hypothetical protein
MTTMISVHNSDGCVGRCDAKCHNAKHAVCHCVCGGRNHGAGKQQAIENTRELAQQWIDAYKAQHPGEDLSFRGPEVQLELLPEAVSV